MWKLRDLLDKKLVSLEAPYQRDIVWQADKMCTLIDSVMNNFYIPPLVFANREDENGRMIRFCIDGKQRLTAIYKFMNNEIPYYDRSNGILEERYFYNDKDNTKPLVVGHKSTMKPRKYISPMMRERFSDAELVCVEYNDLDVEQEYEIFARVQLGMSLTPAEKLKAHATANAKMVKDLWEIHRHDLQRLFPDNRGYVYQLVAHLALVIYENPQKSFPAMPASTSKFLANKSFIPSIELKKSVDRVLNIFVAMIREDTEGIFTSVKGKTNTFKSIEFFVFGLFISNSDSERSVDEYLADCWDFRMYCVNNGLSMRSGTPSFLPMKTWLDQRLEEIGATATVIQPTTRGPKANSRRVTAEPDELDDETEDSDHMGNSNVLRRAVAPVKRRRRIEPSPPPPPLPLPLPPLPPAEETRPPIRGRAVARRGGRRPVPTARGNHGSWGILLLFSIRYDFFMPRFPQIIAFALAMLFISKALALNDDIETAQLIESLTQYGTVVYRTLLGAAALTFTFFRFLFFGIYKVVFNILWPLFWVVRLCWNGFVMKPFALFLHVSYVLYPVMMFCLAAVCCGLVIGGCAGFAAEGFSALLITATWGSEKKKNEQWLERTTVAKEDSVTSDMLENEAIEDDDEDRVPMPKRLSRDSGGSSSYWDASFFGANKKAKGKQAMKMPRNTAAAVESWRNSLSRRSSSSASCPDGLQSMSSLHLDSSLRRRTTYEKQDGWNWVDDDVNDDFVPTGSAR
ncbi:hypothetical protein DFQ28_009028 [Apophysomyces sp. BC1034]|nr:hypothetical protein DFQ28_009028 [Apophysomyces sp. BC1034]